MYLKFLYLIYFKISLLHTCISEITSFRPACCTTQFVSDRGRNPIDSFLLAHMSRVVRKPAFCTRENKDAHQRWGFRYTNSTIPLLHKSRNFKHLDIFCGFTARFVSDLVRNPYDRFSHNEALIVGDTFYNMLRVCSILP